MFASNAQWRVASTDLKTVVLSWNRSPTIMHFFPYPFPPYPPVRAASVCLQMKIGGQSLKK